MRESEPSLAEVIKGCKSGNVKSEERLYKTFYGYMKGVANRYTSNCDDIQELLNDSFMRVFKNIHMFTFHGLPDQLPKAFRGWIGKITANIAIDRLRTKRKMLYIEEMSANEVEMPFLAPDTLSVEDIMQLLEQLPDMQKIIFNMYEIEGFTHEEIAKIIEIPASTSRVYLIRAKTRLRQLYIKMNPSDEQQRRAYYRN